MTAKEWWTLFLGLPPVMIAGAVVIGWVFKEKIAGVVFWALRTYPALWREAAENGGAFRDLFDGDPLERMRQKHEGLERELTDLRAIIREDLAPLAALGPKLVALDYSVQSLRSEAGRLATAVERIPDLATAIEVLKARVDTPPHPRRKP